MPTYIYSGRSASGHPTQGEIEAAGQSQAVSILKQRQVTVSSISVKKSLIGKMNDIQIPV